jgi:cysteinyl-tRNA synthetase
MSKSLGNIITAREAIERFSSDAIRLFFLGSHYRSPLGYSDESVASQERAAERLRNALRPAERGTGKSVDPSAYRHQFIGAMDDDLNTPRAVAALFELAREINRGRERAHDVGAAQDTLKELSGVLGLTLEEPSARSADVAPFVQLLVDLRSELRGTRQFALADRVRDELASLGVSLEDGPEGTAWRLH